MQSRPSQYRPLGDGDLGVWVPFEHKDMAKSLPGARWDKHLKCWRVSVLFAADVAGLVDRLNGGVDVQLVEAFTVMLGSLDADLGLRFYRAASKVLHPDTGGDTKVMQALSQAWEVTR